ncbi:MAG TPA: hypothetical protein VNH11_06225 [Pirellulales bacterium]|nr:hypothetical protein [Pirellulales bacterium]
MPLIYRVMTRDGEKPKVGNTARSLGVRLPPSPRPDVEVNDDGTVEPGRGGMSVSPSLERLPKHRIPKRFAHRVPEVSGYDADACWYMGSGPFEEGPVAHGLVLKLKSEDHGLVEPAFGMPLADYLAALVATRDQWQIEE